MHVTAVWGEMWHLTQVINISQGELPAFLVPSSIKPSSITALHYQIISFPITVQIWSTATGTLASGISEWSRMWLICCDFQLHVMSYQTTYRSLQSSTGAINYISFVAENAVIQSNLLFLNFFKSFEIVLPKSVGDWTPANPPLPLHFFAPCSKQSFSG